MPASFRGSGAGYYDEERATSLAPPNTVEACTHGRVMTSGHRC